MRPKLPISTPRPSHRPAIRRLGIVLLSLALMPAPCPAQQDIGAEYRWGNVPIGGGGYFINVLPHPTRAGELWVDSDMTGPFVRRAPGEAFVNTSYFSHAMDNPTTAIHAVSDIAISAARPDTVFASVRGNGLLRSTDSGKTYQVVYEVSSFTKQSGPELAIDPANPDVIYRGTDDDGLFRSVKGGDFGTWEKVIVSDQAEEKATHLAIFPPQSPRVDGRSGVVYVSVSGLGMHVSRDGGKTFALVEENKPAGMAEAVPAEVMLLEETFEADKSGQAKGWTLLESWMRGAVKLGGQEDRRWLEAGEKAKFAGRWVDLPSNVVEVTLSLEAGEKPHETAGAQLVFMTDEGKKEKANWKKALFLKPPLEQWTPLSTSVVVPRGAKKVGIQIGSQAKAGKGLFSRIKLTGKTDGTAAAPRMNPRNVKQMGMGPDGTLYLCDGKLVAYNPERGWRDLTPEAPGGGVGTLAVHPRKQGYLLVTAGKMEGHVSPLYRSRDDGKTWDGPFFARDQRCQRMSYTDSPAWAFYWPAAGPAVLAFDPHADGRAWIGDAYMVWQCDDVWADELVWSAQWRGLEDTVPVSLAVSPRADGKGTELFAVGADIRGMRWEDPHQLPTNRIGDKDPKAMRGNNMCSIATCENQPLRWYGATNGSWSGPSDIVRSDDGGLRWRKMNNPIPDQPNHGGAKIAVSATNPDVVVYSPGLKLAPRVSRDGGQTWTVAKGVDGLSNSNRNFSFDEYIAADTVDGDVFYAHSPLHNRFYISRDAGLTWTDTGAELPRRTGFEGQNTSPIKLVAKPGVAGTIMLSISDNGLFRSTDYGKSFEKIEPFVGGQACGVSYGTPSPGSDQPTIYVINYLQRDDPKSVFRSLDDGKTWQRIGNEIVETSHSLSFVASRQVFGRVYFGTNGRGVFVGEPK